MSNMVFSAVSEECFREILYNLHKFTSLCVRLTDGQGKALLCFGEDGLLCEKLKRSMNDEESCAASRIKAGRTAFSVGEAYIFTCCGSLTEIAFPLADGDEPLGTVFIGPFLRERPDITVSAELYGCMKELPVIEPARVNSLKVIIEYLLSDLKFRYDRDGGNPYIKRALRYIAENYRRHIDLDEVAAEAGISASYLSALFNSTVGMSFRDYLNVLRIEEGKRLLLTTDHALADIAIALGFPDQSYFTKVFRRISGTSPGKFRQRAI